MAQVETMVVEEEVTQMVAATATEEEVLGLAEEGTARVAGTAMAEEAMAREVTAVVAMAREKKAAVVDMEAETVEACQPAPTR